MLSAQNRVSLPACHNVVTVQDRYWMLVTVLQYATSIVWLDSCISHQCSCSHKLRPQTMRGRPERSSLHHWRGSQLACLVSNASIHGGNLHTQEQTLDLSCDQRHAQGSLPISAIPAGALRLLMRILAVCLATFRVHGFRVWDPPVNISVQDPVCP